MIRWRSLDHRFVKHIPDQLEPGVLYISMEYATAAHSCCCGCGQEVVTPFTPTDWRLTFDGVAVSLWPSVGNWTLPCRSHYVVERGKVHEALPWSDAQIAAARYRDKAEKAAYYGTESPAVIGSQTPTMPPVAPTPGWWTRLRRRVFG